jgi:CheY-like chemotaxis protein
VLAFVAKPIQSRDVLDQLLDHMAQFSARATRTVLVVEPETARRKQVAADLETEELKVIAVADTKGAMKILKKEPVDCIVANPCVTELAEKLLERASDEERSLSRLPVLLYAEEDFDDSSWRRLAGSYSLRRVQTSVRLLDHVTFYTHVNVANLPQDKHGKLMDLHQSVIQLASKKVLIVDDDMRNIFALSAVLEEHDMIIVSADNGRDAIKILQSEPDVDVVLMDIMMPEMDGMETMREIRKFPHLKDLPIVAVTAKAMKGDREKCIEAGAWDYLSKPVDTTQMLSVLRAWLHQ